MKKILDRLESLEHLLTDSRKTTQVQGDGPTDFDWSLPSYYQPVPHTGVAHPSTGPDLHSPHGLLAHEPHQRSGFQPGISPHNEHRADLANTHDISLPSMGRYACLPPLNYIEYDNREDYIQTEINQGALLYSVSDNLGSERTPKACWRLQRLFTKNVLPWIPLFDEEYCVQKVNDASSSDFRTDDTGVALVLFIFALGEMSSEEDNTSDLPLEFAGISNFLEACKIVDTNRSQSDTLVTVQCRILWS